MDQNNSDVSRPKAPDLKQFLWFDIAYMKDLIPDDIELVKYSFLSQFPEDMRPDEVTKPGWAYSVMEQAKEVLQIEPFPVDFLEEFAERPFASPDEAKAWLMKILDVLRSFDPREAEAIIIQYEYMYGSRKKEYGFRVDESMPLEPILADVIWLPNNSVIEICEDDHIVATLKMRMGYAGVKFIGRKDQWRRNGCSFVEGCIFGLLTSIGTLINMFDRRR